MNIRELARTSFVASNSYTILLLRSGRYDYISRMTLLIVLKDQAQVWFAKIVATATVTDALPARFGVQCIIVCKVAIKKLNNRRALTCRVQSNQI